MDNGVFGGGIEGLVGILEKICGFRSVVVSIIMVEGKYIFSLGVAGHPNEMER